MSEKVAIRFSFLPLLPCYAKTEDNKKLEKAFKNYNIVFLQFHRASTESDKLSDLSKINFIVSNFRRLSSELKLLEGLYIF